MVSYRLRAEGYVGQVGAFFDVTERVSWYPSVPLIKRWAIREPRPTKSGRSASNRPSDLSPLRRHAQARAP
jgi:hypothetical protein